MGEFIPTRGRTKLTSPSGLYSPPQPAGRSTCEQSLMSPTQTRTNAQGVPVPAPTPAVMLPAVSPAPAPLASPWLGTAGTVEVRSPRGSAAQSWPKGAGGSSGPRFQREAHTWGGVIFWKILRLGCWGGVDPQRQMWSLCSSIFLIL